MKPAEGANGHRGQRQMIEIGRAESLALLGHVSLGRIVFTQNALPTIRPVNHLLDRGQIVIRTHAGAALTLQTERAGNSGVVVAYEVDDIDPDTHLGWSVIATGYARLVTNQRELAFYQNALEAWVDRSLDCVVRVNPLMVTGFRLASMYPPHRETPAI